MDRSGDYHDDYGQDPQNADEQRSESIEESESEIQDDDDSDENESRPKPPRRGRVWSRLYKDHELRLQRLDEKREEMKSMEEEELYAMQLQVSEDRKWVENRRENAGIGETIDDRMKECGAWWDRLYQHAEEKRLRQQQLQDAYCEAEENDLEKVVMAQSEERARMCAIFLSDRDDSGPWHERLYNESFDRMKRTKDREEAHREYIQVLSTPSKPKSAEDDEDEDDDEAVSNWHERLHADYARRTAEMNLRRKQEAEQELRRFHSNQHHRHHHDDYDDMNPNKKPSHDRLYEDAVARKQRLEKARQEVAKREQDYQDRMMARWMTETQKSRECWPLHGQDDTEEDGPWHDRLHSHNAEREKAFRMERQRRADVEQKELAAGRAYLHNIIKANEKRVRAPLKHRDACERLYTQAKELRERLKEEREENMHSELPSFKPELIARPLKEDKASARGPPKEVGTRLFQAKAKQQAKLQAKRMQARDAEKETFRAYQEERLKSTNERISKVAPKLLEDKREPWQRLYKIPQHWKKQEAGKEQPTKAEEEKARKMLNLEKTDFLPPSRGVKEESLGRTAEEKPSKKMMAGMKPRTKVEEQTDVPVANPPQPGTLFGKMFSAASLGKEAASPPQPGTQPAAGTLFGKTFSVGKETGLKPSASESTLGTKKSGTPALQSSASEKGFVPGGFANMLNNKKGAKGRVGSVLQVNNPDIMAEGPSHVEGAEESF